MPESQIETVKAIALQFYGYEFSDEAAGSVARAAAAVLAGSAALTTLAPDAVEPPFDYQVLLAEASRLRGR